MFIDYYEEFFHGISLDRFSFSCLMEDGASVTMAHVGVKRYHRAV